MNYEVGKLYLYETNHVVLVVKLLESKPKYLFKTVEVVKQHPYWVYKKGQEFYFSLAWTTLHIKELTDKRLLYEL